MTKEKYIEEIIRRLKLSKNTKTRIRQDLFQDIQTAMDQGETLEEIISRMGTPEEAAQEFNESCGGEAVFSAGRRAAKIVMISAIILSSLFLLFQGVLFLSQWYFSANISQSVGVIGGADGPTAIFVTYQFDPVIAALKLAIPVIIIFAGILGLRWIGKQK